MQIKSLVIAALTLASLLADPVLADTEVSKVPPTVVSKVWPAKKAKAARSIVQHTVKPPLDPVAERLKTLHKRMIAKEELTDSEVQELADSGDSLAAFYYARRLEEIGRTSVLPAAVQYYAMATYLGREFAMHRLIALMKSPEVSLSDAQLKNAKNALVKLADGGKTAAALGLAEMYAAGQPFAQDAVESRAWLMRAAKAGDANAAQKLAQAAIMPRDGSPPDVPTARAALTLMVASNEPGKVAMAQALLARLDATDPTEVSQ